MKIVCSQDELLAKLQIAARGVSQRSTVQILSGILLRRIRRAASSWPPPTWSSRCGCRWRHGSRSRARSCCPAACCSRSCARCRPADVTIEQPAGGGAAQLECGPSRVLAEHPERRGLPAAAGARCEPSFTVDRAAFVDTVSHVGRAASKDESRPVLTGVLVELGEGTVTMAATDSYRLSVKESALPGATGEAQAIVPARALAEVARIAAGERRSRCRCRRTRCCSGWTASGCRRGASTASSRTTGSCCRRRSSTRSRSPRTSCWT